MIKNLKHSFAQNLRNIPGWHTNRKIVVIESDDWGSIRMPSKKVYEEMLKDGYRVDLRPFERYDSIATNQDLEFLYEVLNSVKDKNGNSAVFTANAIMANPDFEKIKNSNFNEYYFELFTDTLERYNNSNTFLLWKEGIDSRLFIPQFHGREHINVTFWLEELKKGNIDFLYAFEKEICGIFPKINPDVGNQTMIALKYNDNDDLKFKQVSIKDGLSIFEKVFGFKSKSFMAPCYTWDSEIEKVLLENEVKFIQGSFYQTFANSNIRNKGIYHFCGQKNQIGQTYLTRNCSFEPTTDGGESQINYCLKQIELSFRWKKPAIISSHRINYIGRIDEINRDKNLKSLHVLLHSIVKKWPSVEFMSSDQLEIL